MPNNWRRTSLMQVVLVKSWSVSVRKRVKEFVEISDCRSLDALIEELVQIREGLPEGAEAEVRMRGDDVFGRRLTVSYSLPDVPEATGLDGSDLRAAA